MTSSSELHYPPQSGESLSGGNESGSESAYGTPKIEPGEEGASGLSPEPALVVLPEEQRVQTGGRRRVFQSRRRSRACDACRLRKTKCDTPVQNGPCTSCIAASLVCKFSDTGDERRRAGPARRLRNLEATVKDLTARLEQANAVLAGLGYPPIIQPEASRNLPAPSPGTSPTETHHQYSTREPPIASANSQLGRESMFHSMHPAPIYSSSGAGPNFSYSRPAPSSEQARTRLPAFPGISAFGILQRQSEELSSSAESHRAYGNNNQGDGGPAAWDGNFYGSSSTPFFMSSYRDYLERLGYALPPIRTTSPSTRPLQSRQSTEGRVQGDSQIQRPEKKKIDLRHLLPPKEHADHIKEVYFHSRQVYQPMLYWPLVEKRWKRAWSEPIWEDDEEAVKGTFCVVMMFLAIGSQLDSVVDDSEERQGWHYFEYVRRFHNLFPPAYSMDDAIIFLLIAYYLMAISLPSAAWMFTGATCRVYQDLGLHKMLPENQTSKINQEIRNRLFWSAYLLDRQISIVVGRPTTIQESDISVKLPGEIETSGVDGSEFEDSSCTFQEYQPHGRINSSQMALATYRSLITTCRYFERVRVFQIEEGGSDNDMIRVRELDRELERVWESFPHELTSLDQSSGLQPCAVRLLFDVQHARLLLYRSFADFSQHIRTACRTFCLSQSISVCKTSARLLLRCSRVQNWELNLARRTNETVRVHIFRAAAILLLGYHLKDPGLDRVEKEEVDIVLRSLKAVARGKSMRKPYQMILMAVRMFDYKPEFGIENPTTDEGLNEINNLSVSTAESKVDPMDWRSSGLREIPGTETRSGIVLTSTPGTQHIQQNFPHRFDEANRGTYDKPHQARWHGSGDPQQHFLIPGPSSQPTHSHRLPGAGNGIGQHPSIIQQHSQGQDMQAFNLLPSEPPPSNNPFATQSTPSLVIQPLNPPGPGQAVTLQSVDTHMNLNSLILSSDAGLDWNAFEDMMTSSSDYNHLGFGDLIARGPDLGWSYPLISTQQLSENIVGWGIAPQGHGEQQQHEQASTVNLYQQERPSSIRGRTQRQGGTGREGQVRGNGMAGHEIEPKQEHR